MTKNAIMRVVSRFSAVALIVAGSSVMAKGPTKANAVKADIQPSSLELKTAGNFDGYILKVSGPAGDIVRNFGAQTEISLDIVAENLKDGFYKYELVAVVPGDAENRNAANAGGIIKTGAFTVLLGEMVMPETEKNDFIVEAASLVTDQDVEDNAQVFATDLIVQGSACVGFDCATSESFGSDTFRLKENNLHIHFDDTSASASFPKNDWRISANDTSNGGGEYLAIQDATGNTTPFKIEAGAGNNAIYVASGGNVGIGTASPGGIELNVTDGDSPTVRLAQDGSAGFQTASGAAS